MSDDPIKDDRDALIVAAAMLDVQSYVRDKSRNLHDLGLEYDTVEQLVRLGSTTDRAAAQVVAPMLGQLRGALDQIEQQAGETASPTGLLRPQRKTFEHPPELVRQIEEQAAAEEREREPELDETQLLETPFDAEQAATSTQDIDDVHADLRDEIGGFGSTMTWRSDMPSTFEQDATS